MKAEKEAQVGIPQATSREARHSTLPGHCEAGSVTPTDGPQGSLLIRGEATLKPSPGPAPFPALNP